MQLNILKGTSWPKTTWFFFVCLFVFSYGHKVKISYNMVGPKVDFKISHFSVDFGISHILESSTLTLKSLEGFDINAVFSIKNALIDCYVMAILCPHSQTFKRLVLKNYLFTVICYNAIDKIIVFKSRGNPNF